MFHPHLQSDLNNPDPDNHEEEEEEEEEEDDGEWKQQFFVRMVEKVGEGFIIFYRQYLDDPESKTRCRDIFTDKAAGNSGNIVVCSNWYKIDKNLFLDSNDNFLLSQSEHAESASAKYRVVSFMAKYKDAKIKHFIRSRVTGSLVAISLDDTIGLEQEVSFCPLLLPGMPGILGTIVYTTIPPDSYTVVQKPRQLLQLAPKLELEKKLDYSPPMTILQTLTSNRLSAQTNDNNGNVVDDDDDDFDVDLFLASSLDDISLPFFK